MISIDTKAFEKLISDFIDARDIKTLVDKFSKDRAFYYYILKDITKGRKSINYKILKKVAIKKKVSENFIIEQAKSVLSYIAPYDEPELDNYYEILNVPHDASDEKIREQWIELMKSHHPDKAGQDGLDRAIKINEAYEVLGSRKSRNDYDIKRPPDVPIIVKNEHLGATRVMMYVIPFLLVITISYIYLSSSGLLFKSESDKEIIARNIQNPTLPEIDISNDEDYEVIMPDTKTADSEDFLVETDDSIVDEQNTIEKPEILNETVSARLVPDVDDLDSNSKLNKPSTQTIEKEDSVDNLNEKTDQEFYEVKEGDSLWTISREFDISIDDLNKINNLQDNDLDIGDLIIIKAPEQDTLDMDKSDRAEVVKIIPENDIDLEPRLTAENKVKTDSQLVGSRNVQGSFDSSFATPAVIIDETALRPNDIPPGMPVPDSDSLYNFVSQYVSAYKNRDLNTIRSLFAPNAKENGVSIYKVLDTYKGNFSKLDIIRYDIKVKDSRVDNLAGFVTGDFIVTFRNQETKLTKNSRGQISWLLKWRSHKWEIEEIDYKLHDTKVID